MGLFRAIVGSFFMGGGIAAMHYVGMEAMRLNAMCTYSTGMVVLSVALAVVISFVALWLTFAVRESASSWGSRKVLCALTMGAAIPGDALRWHGRGSLLYAARGGRTPR